MQNLIKSPLQFLQSTPSRRGFLRGTSAATLSAGAVLLLSGQEASAASHGDMANDAGILNVALGLEHLCKVARGGQRVGMLRAQDAARCLECLPEERQRFAELALVEERCAQHIRHHQPP